MKYIISYLIYFAFIYAFYLFTVVLRKNKYEKYKKSTQVMFFVKKYKLDYNNIPFEKFINIVALSNTFIMSTTLLVVEFIPQFFLKVLVAFVVLFILLFIVYKLIGLYIGRKNKHV